MNFLKTTTILFSLASIALFSCKNNCANTDCVNGQCDEKSGQCVCLDSWSGENCSLYEKTDSLYGVLTLYTDDESFSNRNLDVYIDNNYAGAFTNQNYYTTPNCGDANSFTKTLSAGYHQIQIFNGSYMIYNWSEYIAENDCNIVPIYNL